ncbi:MAG: HAMP domain-containing sensor histidine kinase [Chitinophagales bacterium]
MARSLRSRYWLFFHVVFVYIIASFIWWSYLLHKNNYANYHQILSRDVQAYQLQSPDPKGFYRTEAYNLLQSDFRRTEWMLYGEGFVFILLITIGFWRIRKTFREEIDLTRLQNNFLLSITHELKSPLASLKLSMQTMQKRTLDEEKVKNIASMSLDDVERLESLVENILLASKIDSPNFSLNKEWIDISKLAHDIYIRIQNKYVGHRKWVSDIKPGVECMADRFSITSVIYNVIENAIKYSGEGDVIAVRLQQSEGLIALSVSDTGIGIPEEEKDKIFTRFYRIGTEDTRKTKGTGLGLFIVRQVVLLHHGNIQVKDNTPKGSIFEITIPVGE